jgi:hypothetical protein
MSDSQENSHVVGGSVDVEGAHTSMLRTLLRWTGNHAKCCSRFSEWEIKLKGKFQFKLVGCPRHGGIICRNDPFSSEPVAYLTRDGYVMRQGKCIGMGHDVVALRNLKKEEQVDG